ncbi:MAG: DUF6455 family protein [Nevskia sp.]|nr:DUF6455 family protein [Nevskia sp.]
MHSIPLPLQLYVPMVIAAVSLAIFVLLVLSLLDLDVAQRVLLGRRIHGLRLARMLHRRGIDQREYLRLSPLPELRHAVDNCRGCNHQAQCDEADALGSAADPHYSYCPNAPTLDAFERRADR